MQTCQLMIFKVLFLLRKKGESTGNDLLTQIISPLLCKLLKYDKQDQQGKAAFNESKPHVFKMYISRKSIPFLCHKNQNVYIQTIGLKVLLCLYLKR
jgi:hypothetical protein